MRQYAAVILVKEDGSVLVQHRDNIPTIAAPDKWAVVGGRVEKTDATTQEAAARELLEETGYIINPLDLKELTRDTYIKQVGGEGIEVERVIYYAPYDGVQEIKCFEGQSIEFIHPNDFDKIEIFEGHESFLRLASQRFTQEKENFKFK